MFEKLKNIFVRFIHFEDPVFHLLSVIYVVFTHTFDVFDEIPYVLIFGWTGSAKTLLGDLFKGLCLGAIYSSEISDAALYRVIGQKKGQLTLIIDEADDLGGPARRRILLRILLSGFRYNGNVTRCGPGNKVVEFSTFSPKILINEKGIHHSALENRTIPIHMLEFKGQLEEFRSKGMEEELKAAKGTISSFAKDFRDVILDLYVSFKGFEGLTGHDREIWKPLLILSDLLASLLDKPCIRKSIIDLAEKTILERKRRQLIGNRDLQILVSAREFIEQTKPLNSSGLYIAEELRDFIRASLGNPGLTTEAVARTLNRSNLIKERKRPKVDFIEDGDIKTIQKTGYIFNMELLLKLTEKYF